jgi:hypothetical protein
METQTENIGLKIASILLLKKGEISIFEIKSIPFFTTCDQVESAINYLIINFNAEIQSRRIPDHIIPHWEKIIRIKKRHSLNRGY